MPSVEIDAGWTFAPIVLISLAGYLGVYFARWRTSRREGGARAASGWRLAAWMRRRRSTLFVALISPVDRLGEQLASMHMVQHLLIADIAAILFTLGLTRHILRPATRRIHRIERAAGPFASPWFGVIAYVGVMWLWHVPAMYDAALRHSSVHTLEHLTFAAAGLLYWWHLLSPIRSRMRLTRDGAGRLHGEHEAARRDARHRPRVRARAALRAPTTPAGVRWGMSALDDQRVAGLIMAVEQSIVMGIALAWLFVRMLGESEKEEERAERYA